MGDWTAVTDGWECVDCGYVHPGDIDINAHRAHVCGQLSIDDALGDVIPSRSTDPETSHAAAAEIQVRANSQRARLLQAFAWAARRNRYGGALTDEEAMALNDRVSPTSEYSKRCSELRAGGFIEPTGETRAGSAGPQRIVSRITDKGRRWVSENR
jgi:hypothetical protein